MRTFRGETTRWTTATAVVLLIFSALLALRPGPRITLGAVRDIAVVDVEESLIPPRPEPRPVAAPPPPQPPIAPPAPPTPQLESLRTSVTSALAGGAPVVTAHVVVDGIGTVVDMNASAANPPASTQKIYTAFTALSLLGPERRFTTEIRRNGPVSEGTLQGDLMVLGGGDPSLSGADVQRIAAVVASSGIRVIQGGLVGDDSRYDRERTAPGWKPGFVPHNIGSLSALSIDRNSYRQDPAFVADPVTSNLEVFRKALAMAGVTVQGPSVLAKIGDGTEVVASHQSAPLKDLVVPLLEDSDNYFAETLAKELGASAGDGSTAGGMKVITDFAAREGLPLGTAVDGSGLSSLNRQAPTDQTEWLARIGASGYAEIFVDALPISCTVGTLRNRMCGSAAAGRVVAKSGGLNQVATLAGYTTTASGRKVRFSLMLLGSPSGKQARDAMDAALIHITSFSG